MKATNGVSVHRDGYGGEWHPAINVKVYRLDITADDVRRRFGCCEKTAARALEWAWEAMVEDFWEFGAKSAALDCLGDGVEVYQEGRSGGWLVVHGLPEVDTWGSEMREKWAEFEHQISTLVGDATSPDNLIETIEATGWAEPEERDPNEVTARYVESLAGLRGAA